MKIEELRCQVADAKHEYERLQMLLKTEEHQLLQAYKLVSNRKGLCSCGCQIEREDYYLIIRENGVYRNECDLCAAKKKIAGEWITKDALPKEWRAFIPGGSINKRVKSGRELCEQSQRSKRKSLNVSVKATMLENAVEV